MPIKKTKERVNINDRRIINGKDADVIQLHPMRHLFAWDAYNVGNANHWLPTEIGMQKDVEQWKSKDVLSEDERLAFKTVLGFFTTADSIAANNIVLATYRHVTSPEVRMYLLRQAYEEAIHTHAYQYMVESLGLDGAEIYNMYRELDQIYNKASFILTFNEGIFDPNFTTGTLEDDRKFVENLVVFSVIMEGIFFYSAFAVILSFQRQNKMVGSAEQIQYIMRDESNHMNFGIDMIHAIRKERPEIWDQAFESRMESLIREAVGLEYEFATICFPRGIMGISQQGFKSYIEYIADRRLQRLGMKTIYGTANPFPWMSEAIDLSKEKNFFETRVTEYQTGGSLDW
jgi:ribonucleoside-diphosphate reductase beta chain